MQEEATYPGVFVVLKMAPLMSGVPVGRLRVSWPLVIWISAASGGCSAGWAAAGEGTEESSAGTAATL